MSQFSDLLLEAVQKLIDTEEEIASRLAATGEATKNLFSKFLNDDAMIA